MNASILTEVILPLALALIMFGMGLGLTTNDFTRLFKSPLAIVMGLIGQLVAMPLLALGLCYLLNLPTPIAIGLMILAACPGGTMSNVVSQLAKANLALSVSLTAASTAISIITTPFIIGFAMSQFAPADDATFSILTTSLGLFFITLVPVAIGIWLRHFKSDFAIKAEPFFRRFSLFFMLMMIAALVIKERDLLVSSFNDVFWACIALNIGSMVVGWLIAKCSKLNLTDSLTLSIEVGIQNASLAILIAISFLNKPEYAVTGGVYGLAMFIGPLLLIGGLKLKNKRTARAVN
ncbi:MULTISPECIES: bile acid:sodium symporter family protein [Pseudoalteromonas]|uniref:Bile acid:sodium symporter family protein n=1 Tax=Pseudoalteromonas arctica TaxID=394751 RepID=A0ABU9TIG8_9GAMM|nr:MULTISPECIES: bile acid:sodium symporter family protein [unclassified Pseudoalteromonas]MBG9998951.1 bile acid:sodium symporter family protein [Pseudoalteromonas sp. NSLLW24]MBH0001262.1 bile acid:sodium symporter family protein [Pseudoalteromonas sp. SWYJZ12]MBH0033104.1 bile acid:sodium symporter family protein [Pseudoalteromonas sp. NZS71_1]MBH0045949.1 bile acid:sodium symporter family protein [Pseudoalteromonas sp. NZS11_1]MBH0062509.1 bile acid:sodium symporter family protein [Pseudoa